MQDVALAVERVDLFEAQDLLSLDRRVGDVGMDDGRTRAGVDFLHALVVADLVRRAGHEDLALVHHGDAMRETEHTIDVVLDDQHGDVGGDVLDQVGHALALRRRQSGERLIEQQDLRLAAERNP